jgi:hypothetical protein
MSKVDRCYNIVTPKKGTCEAIGNTYSDEGTKSPRKQLFQTQEMEEEINGLHDGFKQGTQDIDMDTQVYHSDELWADMSQDQVSKDGSADSEVYGSNEGRYSNTIYHGTSRIESNTDGSINIFSYEQSIVSFRDDTKQGTQDMS